MKGLLKSWAMVPLLLLLLTMISCKRDAPSGEDRSQPDKMFQVRKMKVPLWLKNATLYEVDIRNYTNEGTFRAFRKHLSRLRKMGIMTVIFTPVNPIGFEKRKGTLGNPYAVADFTKVNPELGSFEDFRDLTLEIQDMGMHVVLDWVGNHTSWDHAWINTQPKWFVRRNDTISHPYFQEKPTVWTDVAELDYSVEPLRSTMIESMKFWLRSADVDGFRCHASQQIPDDFWAACRPALETVKQVFMIAEAEGTATDFENCFQATNGWTLYQLFHSIKNGQANGEDLRSYIREDRKKYPAGYFHVNYTGLSNPGHQPNPPKLYAPEADLAMATLMMTMEGIPMIQGGQETGLPETSALYEKEEIIWDETPLQDFYTKLIQLKKYNKALYNGMHGGRMELLETEPEVFAFLREKDGHRVAVVVNCSDRSVEAPIEIADGSLTDLFTGRDFSTQENGRVKLGPWQHLVLANPSIAFD